MYFVSIPAGMAINSILADDEVVACTNATVIQKTDGSFAGWVDNNSMIAFLEEEETEDV